ncbi:putative lipid II flippase FtsW [Ruminococcaceae bacterium OttesenSCG-928-L11]|nr:putative lipid II flippase FtsW [Ruminococcaceae bacterium OttesenSCG-928-L11]
MSSRAGVNPRNQTSKPRFSLFSVRVGGIDLTFLILVLLLLTIGLVMLFSASYADAYYKKGGDSFYFISRQVVFAIMGVALMFIISTLNYKMLENMAWPIFFGTLALLVVVLFFQGRSRRWIDLGFITFQPSEIAKFSVVILFAHLINVMYDKMHTFRHGIMPFVGVLGVVGALMMAEPHLSGTLIILAIGAIMMIVGGANLKWFGIAAIVGVCGLAVVVMIPGVINYAGDRVQTWLDPWADPQGDGFQVIQSLYAIGSGGLMGTGIGASRQKYLYLPEPQNDYIFSIVCEELGFVGATLIIILFALLVWRGFVIGMRCRDRFGSMVAVGLTSQVGLQTILNIMVITNTIPSTGISLPFFSAGGTALIMLLCEMGVILAISRETTMEKAA